MTLGAPAIRARKRRHGDAPLVMVTAYDEPGARYVAAAGIDMILVGDSLANVVLGQEDTLHVTLDDDVPSRARGGRRQARCAHRGRHALVELPRRTLATACATPPRSCAAARTASSSKVVESAVRWCGRCSTPRSR